jgi:hypothetical protein
VNVLIRLKYQDKFREYSPEKQFNISKYYKLFVNSTWIDSILGGFKTPIKNRDLIIFWINNKYPVSTKDLDIYMSKAPDVKNIPEYMSIINVITAFQDTHYHLCYTFDNVMHSLGKGYPWIPGYIKFICPETFLNTLKVEYIEGDVEMNRWAILYDYTYTSVEIQLKICNAAIKWHSHMRDNLKIWKHQGLITFRSIVTDSQIKTWVEENFLAGYIWFIKGPPSRPSLNLEIAKYGHTLVNSKILIYGMEEFKEMIDRYIDIKKGE